MTTWSTPGLVETRFSPDALVWVAVVSHGTAAWRNHGLIIFRFCFIEHLSSCPAWWRAPPARPPALLRVRGSSRVRVSAPETLATRSYVLITRWRCWLSSISACIRVHDTRRTCASLLVALDVFADLVAGSHSL